MTSRDSALLVLGFMCVSVFVLGALIIVSRAW